MPSIIETLPAGAKVIRQVSGAWLAVRETSETLQVSAPGLAARELRAGDVTQLSDTPANIRLHIKNTGSQATEIELEISNKEIQQNLTSGGTVTVDDVTINNEEANPVNVAQVLPETAPAIADVEIEEGETVTFAAANSSRKSLIINVPVTLAAALRWAGSGVSDTAGGLLEAGGGVVAGYRGAVEIRNPTGSGNGTVTVSGLEFE